MRDEPNVRLRCSWNFQKKKKHWFYRWKTTTPSLLPSPCVLSKTSPCVPAPSAHVETCVRVVTVHTGTFWTGHTGFFQCVTPHTTHHTPHTTTQDTRHKTQLTTTHNNRNNTQQHTETKPERDRERRQRKREEKTEEEKQDKTREQKKEREGERQKTRREKRTQDEDKIR